MFSAKAHPFLEQTIRNLIAFDHSYIMNYPTVMFSTGPMFLSAQYGLYTATHPFTPDNPGEVRILPKSLYGKNAKVEEAPNAFVSHHYGSSWHADDAAFILFLGRSGMRLMWFGFFVLILGVLRLFFQATRRAHPRSLHKRFDWTEYDLLLPQSHYRSSHLDMHSGGSSTPTSNTSTSPLSSPTYTSPPSPTPSSWIPLVPFSIETSASSNVTNLSSLFERAGAWARARVPGDLSSSSAAASLPRTFIGRAGRARSSTHNKHGPNTTSGGVTFLLPAIFAMPSSKNKNASAFPKTHTVGRGGREGRDGVPRLRTLNPGRRYAYADPRVRMEKEFAATMQDLEAGGAGSLPSYYSSTGPSRRQQSRVNVMASSSRPWDADEDGWE